MNALKNSFREILRYPSAIAGLVAVLALVVVAVYAMIAIPYSKAIALWRGGEEVWYANPKFAPPAWINLFRSKKLPVSFHANSADGGMEKVVTPGSGDTATVKMSYTFDFEADAYPQELMLYFTTIYKDKMPFASVSLFTPDGREIRVADTGLEPQENLRFSQQDRLVNRYGGGQQQYVMQGLFSDPKAATPTPLKGKYQLVITGTTFEAGSDINADFVFHGLVYGLAGTDMYRRDLMVALLWGTPVALAFGLLASLGISIATLIIAAVGAWYGGWVDEIIQRITEVNMVLPFLPILIMIGTFFNRSITTILGATILLSIFGGGIKANRAIFLQLRESMYIEAARAYGASNMRIIFQYMIPRMIPLLIPQLVSGVAGFVFLEATLAVLGLGDPTLPTWGKIIDDAFVNGALYQGYYYWILEPAALLMFTGLGFALLGFSLDRIFNPRLRGM
jgi:peptide/nickel transport system permease protein